MSEDACSLRAILAEQSVFLWEASSHCSPLRSPTAACPLTPGTFVRYQAFTFLL
jgi:hypothetical protein